MSTSWSRTSAIAANKSELTNPWYPWLVCFSLWAVYAGCHLTIQGVGSISPFMKADMKLSATQVGLLPSFVSLGLCTTTIPAGWLVDRFGVSWAGLYGALACGIGMMALFFVSSFTAVLFVMFLGGLGNGFTIPATTNGIVEWFPAQRRGTAMSIKMTGLNFATLIAAATMPSLAKSHNWHVSFFLLGLIPIAAAIVIVSIYRTPPWLAPASTFPAKLGAEPTTLVLKAEPWQNLLKSRDIWLICFAGTWMAIVQFSTSTFLMLTLREVMLVPVVLAGFILSMLGIGGIIMKPLTGIISDIVLHGNRKTPYLFLTLVATVMSALIAIIPRGAPEWLLFLCALLLGFGTGAHAGLFNTYVAELAGRAHVGKLIGVTLLFQQLGIILGVPVFGLIVDHTHSYRWGWWYVASAGAIASLLTTFTREEQKRIKD
jgi:sugar phosphate permease